MTTNVEILEAAYRLVGVVGEADTVSAEQGSVGLSRLNQLMAQFAVDDIDVGYVAQSSTTDICPIPPWAERGVISKLAKDLLGVYPNAQLSGEFTNDEVNGFAVLRRLCMIQKLKGQATTHLGFGEGWTGAGQTAWSINDGP